MTKIPVWQMIHEAVNAMTKEVFSVDDIRSYIFEHFGVVNNGTIGTQAYACTVNRQGRVNAPENKKPRIADGKLDFLYTVGRGLFTRFDPDTHGIWEITEQDGKLMVQRVDGQTTPVKLSASYESRSNTVKPKPQSVLILKAQIARLCYVITKPGTALKDTQHKKVL